MEWQDWTIIGFLIAIVTWIAMIFGHDELIQLFNNVKGN